MQNNDSDKFVSFPPEVIWIDQKDILTSLKKFMFIKIFAIVLNTIIREFSQI